MSNITQFFPGSSSGSGGFVGGFGANSGKKNRRIFVGPLSTTWSVPNNVTEIEVHCWGGGGIGGTATASPSNSAAAGGGGGGYVCHLYPVTSSDVISITVGDSGGTSSVTVPTQSPTSPISALGGSAGTPATPGTPAGGSGGTGAFTIAPGISTTFTFAYRGGSGGNASLGNCGGGGGAAGSFYGNGGNGGSGSSPGSQGGAGGGLRSNGTFGINVGICSFFSSTSVPSTLSTFESYFMYEKVGYGGTFLASVYNGSDWFYVDQISGISSAQSPNGISKGAGYGGRGAIPDVGNSVAATPGAAFGGGGGGSPAPTPLLPTVAIGSSGGIGGGGGGNYASPLSGTAASGGVGCVIIYW